MNEPTPVTILFADIAGSTALYEKDGDTAAMDSVTTCLGVLMDIASVHSGTFIKTLGDEILCRFDVPDNAVLAANAMQSAMSRDVSTGNNLRLRIGIHHGPVVMVDGDVFGDTVNLASRIVSLANPGQVLTSRPTFEAMSDYLKASCRRLYSTTVKGRTEKVTIFEAIWRQDEGMTVVSNNEEPDTLPSNDTLQIHHRNQHWQVNGDQPTLTIGRDAGNQLAVNLSSASRHHATISLRKGRYVLTDMSSNGTYVSLADGADFVLHREELVLSGAGSIGLGCPVAQCGADVVEFEIQR